VLINNYYYLPIVTTLTAVFPGYVAELDLTQIPIGASDNVSNILWDPNMGVLLDDTGNNNGDGTSGEISYASGASEDITQGGDGDNLLLLKILLPTAVGVVILLIIVLVAVGLAIFLIRKFAAPTWKSGDGINF